MSALRAIFRKPTAKAAIASRGDEIARWRYGTAADDPLVKTAEELRRVRLIDTANPLRDEQRAELSGWLSRVKRAVDNGDADFFEAVAEALRLIEAKPSAARDAKHFALLTVREFRRLGIEPTKGDVQEEVARFIARLEKPEFGEPSEFKRTQGMVKWPDVWKSHPELATLRGGNKRKRQRLPEE